MSAQATQRSDGPHLSRARLARLNGLAWFGVFGGATAWALQFLLSLQFGLARCESPDARFPLPVHAFSIGLGAAGVMVGALAELAAWRVFHATRETRNDDALQLPRPEGLKGGVAHDPPVVSAGRLRFLGAVGLTVNPLTLTICAMTAVGVPLLSICHQS
ncbi:MAG TPA: hypothetical protein VL979_05985 [Solirubrobacteraceae bacterium]|nr:hypothetical protein [Solirubrobacteraceae bacterium]